MTLTSHKTIQGSSALGDLRAPNISGQPLTENAQCNGSQDPSALLGSQRFALASECRPGGNVFTSALVTRNPAVLQFLHELQAQTHDTVAMLGLHPAMAQPPLDKGHLVTMTGEAYARHVAALTGAEVALAGTLDGGGATAMQYHVHEALSGRRWAFGVVLRRCSGADDEFRRAVAPASANREPSEALLSAALARIGVAGVSAPHRLRRAMSVQKL